MPAEARLTFHAGYLDESPAVSQALGLFVARWSLAEMTLIMPLVWATNCTQEVAAAMLASTNSAEGKIKLVRSAVVHSSRPNATEQKKVVDRALRDFVILCEARNEMMHHLWGVRSDGLVVTIDYRKPSDGAERFKGRTIETIIEACNSALTIAHRLCQATGSAWVDANAVEKLTLKVS